MTNRLAILALLACTAAAAQQVSGVALGTMQPPQQQQQGPTGTVTGTVLAGDTQRPARFVQVLLSPVPTDNNNDRRGYGGGSARTGLDGTFTMTGVAPGDYYVMAMASGYIPERNLAQAAANAGQDPTAVLAKVPVVHVTANGEARTSVTLVRGGTISGRVQWEDGSAASGVSMSVVAVAKQVPLPGTLDNLRGYGGPQNYVQTDDRGNFRLSGLTAGDYYVMATVVPGSQGGGFGGFGRSAFVSPIRIYAPNVFRKADATPVSVREGDDRSDLRIVLDFARLHKVTGRVTASDPNQTVQSGSITVADPSDADITFRTSIASDGTFTLPFVPAGNYNLSVPTASNTAQTSQFSRGGPNGRTSRTSIFQPLTMSITVGDTDLSGLTLALAPAASASNQ